MKWSHLCSLCLLVFGIAISCGKQETEPTPESETLTYENTGLPIIYIDTEDGAAVTSKETYKKATVKIVGVKGLEGLEMTECQIKGHGHTTWGYKKKPYLVRFDKKTSVLGMPKHKRWILLANFLDKTLMRNLVAYKISSFTTLQYTPKSIQCELVFNGRHAGTYQLIEQIRVDKNRLDIDEDAGYLFELDGHFKNEIQWIDPHGKAGLSKYDGKGIPFSIRNPDPETISEEKIQWGKDYIYNTAEAVYNGDFSGLDLRSFADYFIVFEATINHELLNPCSVFMYKDKDGLLTAGPAWDFDWGTFSYVDHSAAKKGLLNKSAIWYAALLADPGFQKIVYERWSILYPRLSTEIPEYIEEQRKALRKTAALNFMMWDPTTRANYYPINGDETMTFDEAVDQLKSIYLEHLATMNKAISKWK